MSTRQNFPFGQIKIFIACVEGAGYFIWSFFLRWRPQNGAQVTRYELSLRSVNTSHQWNLSSSVTRPLHYQETKAVTAAQLTLNKGVSGGDDFNSCSSVKAERRLLAENILLLKRKGTKKERSH